LTRWCSSTLVRGNYDILPATPLGSWEISQAGSCRFGWTGSYGHKDREGARNRGHRAEYFRTEATGCDALGSDRLRPDLASRDLYKATATFRFHLGYDLRTAQLQGLCSFIEDRWDSDSRGGSGYTYAVGAFSTDSASPPHRRVGDRRHPGNTGNARFLCHTPYRIRC